VEGEHLSHRSVAVWVHHCTFRHSQNLEPEATTLPHGGGTAAALVRDVDTVVGSFEVGCAPDKSVYRTGHEAVALVAPEGILQVGDDTWVAAHIPGEDKE
jgi:hypothetical protein